MQKSIKSKGQLLIFDLISHKNLASKNMLKLGMSIIKEWEQKTSKISTPSFEFFSLSCATPSPIYNKNYDDSNFGQLKSYIEFQIKNNEEDNKKYQTLKSWLPLLSSEKKHFILNQLSLGLSEKEFEKFQDSFLKILRNEEKNLFVLSTDKTKWLSQEILNQYSVVTIKYEETNLIFEEVNNVESCTLNQEQLLKTS